MIQIQFTIQDPLTSTLDLDQRTLLKSCILSGFSGFFPFPILVGGLDKILGFPGINLFIALNQLVFLPHAMCSQDNLLDPSQP